MRSIVMKPLLSIRHALQQVLALEGLNFVLTNALPRKTLTVLMGRLSKLRHPLASVPLIALWRLFCNVDLSEARQQRFESLHQAFIRPLRDGARPVDQDPDILCSPSDGIVIACGRIEDLTVLQVKGRRYAIDELLGDAVAAQRFRDGCYATLRLTAGMYHRFHCPYPGVVNEVLYQPGDVWNVNPPALRRVDRLYCRNERAAVHMRIGAAGLPVALVPVAAILVASIRLHFIDLILHLRYAGPHRLSCQSALEKGQEMGWFEHGSTIVVLVPAGFSLAHGIHEGVRLKAGQALMRLPSGPAAAP